jgi:hypothetical protein
MIAPHLHPHMPQNQYHTTLVLAPERALVQIEGPEAVLSNLPCNLASEVAAQDAVVTTITFPLVA